MVKYVWQTIKFAGANWLNSALASPRWYANQQFSDEMRRFVVKPYCFVTCCFQEAKKLRKYLTFFQVEFSDKEKSWEQLSWLEDLLYAMHHFLCSPVEIDLKAHRSVEITPPDRCCQFIKESKTTK